jgi:hypothetical protein
MKAPRYLICEQDRLPRAIRCRFSGFTTDSENLLLLLGEQFHARRVEQRISAEYVLRPSPSSCSLPPLLSGGSGLIFCFQLCWPLK